MTAVHGEVECGTIGSEEDIAAVFSVREEVFVVEQKVPIEEELDAYDAVAIHFAARLRTADSGQQRIVATARLIDKGEGVGKVGRVAVRAPYRGRGIGAELMRCVERHARSAAFHRLILEAQTTAIPFYERLGYTAEGDVFLDANIEHRLMWKNLALPGGETAAAAQ